MSTAIATAAPAPHDRVSPHHFSPALGSTREINHSNITSAPASVEPASKRPRSHESSPTASSAQQQPGSAEKRGAAATGSGKNSPTNLRSGHPPSIKVKKEPGSSPSMPTSRPRPKRLDLSSSLSNSRGPQTARPSAPLTSRESAGLAIQDVGLACLSPGFATHDPAMREQLQRSLDVRDQQRMIIEARQKGGKPGSSHADEPPPTAGGQDTTLFGVQTRTPATSRRKGPPPALSIAAPSAAQFANDRVIQSAPLHQTFTGLRPGEHPYSRHAQHGPSGLSQTSHIHHVPATQTNNRLPPIADVFANDRLEAPRTGNNYSPSHPSHTQATATAPPPLPSPSFPPPNHRGAQHAHASERARDFRSAEEAVHSLSAGRDDLRPKIVHHYSHGPPTAHPHQSVHMTQPPTPPSPLPPHHPYASAHHHSAYPVPQTAGPRTTFSIPDPPAATARGGYGDRPTGAFERTTSLNGLGGRRRGREEYERDQGPGSSPMGRQEAKRWREEEFEEEEREREGMKFRERERVREEERGGDWRQGLSGEQKREEFLRLCERAWDLFHS